MKEDNRINKNDIEYDFNEVKMLTPEENFTTESRYDFNYFDFYTGSTVAHKHNYYEFFLVLEGEATHIVNTIPVKIKRNSLVALNPSDSHAYVIDKGENLKILNMAFSADTVVEILNIFYSENGIDFYSQCPTHLQISENTARMIVENCNSFHIYTTSKRITKTHLKAFFMNLISVLVMNKTQSDSDFKQELPEWLSASLVGLLKPANYYRGLDYLIEKTGKNQSYLCRIFRKKLNCTPTEYINSIRLNQACFAIEHTDKKIIDICYDCGFSSVSYFNSLFKEKYGVSPDKFRRR